MARAYNFSSAMNTVRTNATNFGQGLQAGFGVRGGGMYMVNPASTAGFTVGSFIRSIPRTVYNTFLRTGHAIVQVAKNVWNAIRNGMTKIVNGIRTVFHKFKQGAAHLIEMIAQGPAYAAGYARGANTGYKFGNTAGQARGFYKGVRARRGLNNIQRAGLAGAGFAVGAGVGSLLAGDNE